MAFNTIVQGTLDYLASEYPECGIIRSTNFIPNPTTFLVSLSATSAFLKLLNTTKIKKSYDLIAIKWHLLGY